MRRLGTTFPFNKREASALGCPANDARNLSRTDFVELITGLMMVVLLHRGGFLADKESGLKQALVLGLMSTECQWGNRSQRKTLKKKKGNA